jgi:hypothetical protein
MCHARGVSSTQPTATAPPVLRGAFVAVEHPEDPMDESCHHEPCTCRATGEGSAPDYCSEPCALGKIAFGQCTCEHPECKEHE